MNGPPTRQRIVNIPLVLLALVGLMLAIQAVSEALSPESYWQLLRWFAFVPGRLTFALDPDRIASTLDELERTSGQSTAIARFFLGDGSADWWTTLTYALLHASWLHVGLNCLMLVAFGSPVARRFGTPRFLLFAIASALAGAAFHYLTHADDLQPVIGASAIVSGVTAAAARFAFRSLEPDATHVEPALALGDLLKDRRVMTFVGFWLAINFATGLAGGPFGLGDAPVAWEAHLGGFLFGLFAFPLFDPVPREALFTDP